MSLCGHDCGCNTPCDKPVTLEELLDATEKDDLLNSEEVEVSDLIQRVKERRMGL